MHQDKRPSDTPLESGLEHIALLDTFSDAVIFLDTIGTILAANDQAATIIGIDKQALSGQILWQAAPHLVTTTFYQAVIQATNTNTSFQIECYFPTSQSRFNVYLAPTHEGIALFLHALTESTPLQSSTQQLHGGYLGYLEDVSEWLAIMTPDGLLLEINQQPLTDAQTRREDVIGKSFTSFPALSTAPDVQKQLQAAIAQARAGETVHIETRLHLPTGKSLDIALTLTPHRNGNQQIEYLICTGRDITERKQKEEELRALVDAIPQFIWIADANGNIVYNNQSMCNYQAMTIEQVKGSGWTACVHPDDREYVWQDWQTSIRTGTPYEVEHRMRDGNSGEYRWFLVRGMPQRDAQGVIQSWIGTATDIDEKKQAEERIKTSEQNFRMLAETVPHLVWTMWPSGQYEYVNQRYRELTQANFGISGDDLWSQFVHPDDLAQTMTRRHHSLDTGENYENEFRVRDGKTGEYRWFLGRAYPLRDNEGNVIKWFGTGTDIDKQKRTEEALRQSQRQVKALMASNVIGIVTIEGEKIVEANDTFLRMTGYSREDMQKGRVNWMEMTAPEYVTVTREAHAQLDKYEFMAPFEKEYIAKSGCRLAVLVGGVVIQSDPVQAICFALDNSARKELELRKDAFISMAGHELKTPLTALKMRIQLLRQRLERQGQTQAVTAFAKVEEPIQRLERLIGELLDVSKMQAGKLEFVWEAVDLSTLVRDVAETMQQINTSHTIVVHAEQPVIVEGDRGRIEQVIINLLSNAIKYSPKAGTVEVSLNNIPEVAVIQVRDYGTGIPLEQRERIFERFYRVADAQSETIPGLGMGLYIVKEIVKQHQGVITVESEVGEGSVFQVTLPLKKEV